MIRVVMLGRLGNNLFQYAAGLALARRHDVPLVLDASWFNRSGWRQVSCIRRLPIRARVVRTFSPASRLLRNMTGRHHWEWLHRPVFREDPGDQRFRDVLSGLPSECVLMGYFQSPLHFRAVEEELRADLDMQRIDWPAAVRREAEAMSADGVVAVHVRRTDYLTLPQFAVCGDAYYDTCMDILRGRIPGARFVIFSDDPEWCAARFRGGDCRVAGAALSAGDPLVDLFLMSCASHHIIANSSYSWWAAWLGRKPGQQVLCPPRWYAGGIDAPIGEKLCPGWETVDFPGALREECPAAPPDAVRHSQTFPST